MRDTSCCGLKEFHGLHLSTDVYAYGQAFETQQKLNPGRAWLATTTWDQKAQVVQLKKLGFKKVGAWRNGNTQRTVTFWFWHTPVKPRKKRKSGRS